MLPDRNTIPHDVAFFQNLRERIPEICHKHGLLAIGGMTALFPDRSNAELNARALAALEQDKRNESTSLFDGAWTGHPDQNAIAVAQFPDPNHGFARKPGANPTPDLRPSIAGVGQKTEAGTRAAVRTVIRYRHGYLSGLGASLLDGYMEDLATDRIYRLMIRQRIDHGMHTRGRRDALLRRGTRQAAGRTGRSRPRGSAEVQRRTGSERGDDRPWLPRPDLTSSPARRRRSRRSRSSARRRGRRTSPSSGVTRRSSTTRCTSTRCG